MAMPQPTLPDFSRNDWTIDDIRALPEDGNRYEVIDGELLMTPSPTWLHQRAVRRLSRLLETYAESINLECMSAPAEVAFSRRRVVEPDVFVVPLVEGKLASRFEEVGRLTLVVEVISPSSARSDRYKKRHLYQSEGVPEYWIVDADARYVERWRPSDEEPEVLIETLEWKPLENEPPLVIDLAALFRKVYGEGERGDTA